jgi:uncharacterized protein YecT (DUF1311 family)
MSARRPLRLLRNAVQRLPSTITRSTVRYAAGLAIIVAVMSPAEGRESATREAPLRPTYYTCIRASNGVTSALNACIGAEHDFQDKRLNTAYQLLGKTLPDGERKALRGEERAWIAHRDKTCAPDASGGNASLLDANQCQLDETAARAAALEARLSR